MHFIQEKKPNKQNYLAHVLINALYILHCTVFNHIFNYTIILLALVEYEMVMVISAIIMCFVDYLPSHNQPTLVK